MSGAPRHFFDTVFHVRADAAAREAGPEQGPVLAAEIMKVAG